MCVVLPLLQQQQVPVAGPKLDSGPVQAGVGGLGGKGNPWKCVAAQGPTAAAHWVGSSSGSSLPIRRPQPSVPSFLSLPLGPAIPSYQCIADTLYGCASSADCCGSSKCQKARPTDALGFCRPVSQRWGGWSALLCTALRLQGLSGRDADTNCHAPLSCAVCTRQPVWLRQLHLGRLLQRPYVPTQPGCPGLHVSIAVLLPAFLLPAVWGKATRPYAAHYPSIPCLAVDLLSVQHRPIPLLPSCPQLRSPE